MESNCLRPEDIPKGETLVEYALSYEQLGWFVLPIDPIKKQPIVKWANRKHQRPTPNEIEGWFAKRPDARIGIATGSPSGVDAVDLDGPKAYARFEALYGIPETIMQSTGREDGGLHLLFKHSDNGLRNVAGKGEDRGIDLRTSGGFVVVAPSAHKSGKCYQWGSINPIEDGLDDLLEMPLEVAKHFKKQNGNHKERKPIKLDPVERGARNDTLTRLIGKWINQGMDTETVYFTAAGWNNELSEPLDGVEVKTIVESVFRTHARNHPDEAELERKAIQEESAISERKASEVSKYDAHEETKLIPTGLFQDYINFVSPFLEAPTAFSIFTMAHTISCIIGRGCYIQQGLDTIYPNQYTLIVAPSSLFKKTTAIKPHFTLLQAVGRLDGFFVGHMGSPEGMMDALNDNGTAFLFYSEFGLLLAQAGKKYMSDAIELLCDLYDCPNFITRKLAGSKKTAENVCLNLIAGTQLSSLTDHIKEQTLLSGFLPRFTVVYSEKLKPHIVRRPAPDAKLQNKIIKHLQEIKRATQEQHQVDFSEEGWKIYTKWATQRHKQGLKASGKIQPLFGRLESQCQKFAIIIGKTADPEATIFDGDVVEMAIKWADFCLHSYSSLVMEELSFSDSDRELKRLEDIIKKAGSTTHRTVVNATKWGNKKIEYNASILQEMGKIRIGEGKRGGKVYTWLG